MPRTFLDRQYCDLPEMEMDHVEWALGLFRRRVVVSLRSERCLNNDRAAMSAARVA